MKYLAQVTVIAIIIFPLTIASTPLLSSLTFRVLDADSGTTLGAKVFVDGTRLVDDKYVLALDASSQIAIEVSADAGNPYPERRLTIFLAGLNQQHSIYNIYMAKSNYGQIIYTRGSVRKASEFINKDSVDRAVVLLERINEEAAPALKETQFGIYLRYNLARAYFSNCTLRFVDQCGLAKNLFDDLLQHYSVDEQSFEAEHITKDDLNNSDIDIHYKRNDYLRAKWDLSRGRLDDAISTFEKLLNEAQENSTLLNSLGITSEGLKRDIDFARSKSKLSPHS